MVVIDANWSVANVSTVWHERYNRRRIKTAEEPQIEKDTVLGDLQCKLQHMNGRGNLRGCALEAP